MSAEIPWACGPGESRDVLERAKARTDAFLAEQRAKNTPGDVAGPGPVAAPARPTSATTPPTLPAEDAPALSAGGVSLPETDEDPYLETLTRQVEDEIAAEGADETRRDALMDAAFDEADAEIRRTRAIKRADAEQRAEERCNGFVVVVEEPDPRHYVVTPWAEKQARNGFLPSPPKGGLPW